MATKQPISNLSIKTSTGQVVTSSTKISGSKQLVVTGSANTGRYARQSRLTITVTGTTATKNITVNQDGAVLNLVDGSDNSYSIAQNASSRVLLISGTTNGKMFSIKPLSVDASTGNISENTGTKINAYFNQGSGYPSSYSGVTPAQATLSDSIKLNGTNVSGVVTGSGAGITGDPGKDSTFGYSYEVTVPLNTAEVACCYAFRIIASGDDVDGAPLTNVSRDIIITSAKGDLSLIVKESSQAQSEKLSYTFDSNNSVQFYVESNTSWTIG